MNVKVGHSDPSFHVSAPSETDARDLKYQRGQQVRAAVVLNNDGSHTAHDPDAWLVPDDASGEIVKTDVHVESNTPVYMVKFSWIRPVAGFLEQEITPE